MRRSFIRCIHITYDYSIDLFLGKLIKLAIAPPITFSRGKWRLDPGINNPFPLDLITL